MTIPFATLAQVPNPNKSWQASFLRHNGGRQVLVTAAFPQREAALLLFTSARRTDRSLLWWSGAPDWEDQRNAAIVQEFMESGWQVHLAASEDNLLAFPDPCDAYWFRAYATDWPSVERTPARMPCTIRHAKSWSLHRLRPPPSSGTNACRSRSWVCPPLVYRGAIKSS